MSPLDQVLSRRVVFVTGKGGVGKSTIAAALALTAHRRGMRVLAVDVDARGDLARFLGAAESTYRAQEALPGLWHLAIHPEDALEEYLRRVARIPRLYKVGPVSRVFDFIATAAPGVQEVLIAGKIWYEEQARRSSRSREPRWDIVIVDAAPSGQVLSHIRGPRTLMELVSVGLIRQQSDSVRDVLEDPDRTGLVVVSLLEEMPTAETEELLARTPTEVNTPVIALVANQRAPEPPAERVLAAVTARTSEISEAAGVPLGTALDAAGLWAKIHANQAPYAERLERLGPPVIEVPSLALIDHTLEVTARLADHLESDGSAS